MGADAQTLIAQAYQHVSPAAQEIIASYTPEEQARLSVRSEEEFSTVFIPIDFFDARPAAPAQVFTHAVIKGGTVYSCFDYAAKDQINDRLGINSGGTRLATGAMTSLTKKGEVSGAFERAIEGLALAANGLYVAYADTVANFNVAAILNGQAALTNVSVQNAYLGKAAWTADQAARAIGPQLESPFILEDMVTKIVREHCRIETVFDDVDRYRIGKCNHVPDNGGRSLKDANGLPSVTNYYPIPEGQRWARSGEKGSTFRLDVYVEDDIVFPVDLVALWGIPAPSGTGAPVPTGACVGIQFTLVGPKIGLPSSNR
jgi:hypothetical protein